MLMKRFPPPATVRLENHDGIIGVITSDQFATMETIDRQNLIGDIVATQLSFSGAGMPIDTGDSLYAYVRGGEGGWLVISTSSKKLK